MASGTHQSKPGGALRPYLRACHRPVAAAAVFSLVVNLLMLVPPIYMLQMYDRVLPARSTETLALLTLVVAGLLALMGAMEWLRQRVMVRASSRLDDALSRRLYDALHARALTQGGADSQPMRDAAQLRQFLTGSGLFAFLDAPWLPIFLVVLVLFHPLIGLVAAVGAAVLAFLAVANHYVSRHALARASAAQVAEGQVLDDQLRHGEVAAALGMIPALHRHWDSYHQASLGWQARASEAAAPFHAAGRAVRLLLQVLVLGTGAYLAIEQAITPGVMIAAAILLTRALAPMDQLIGQWRGIADTHAAYRRLDALVAAQPAATPGMALPRPKGKLAAEQLVVTPPGRTTATVRGVTLTLAPGETAGVLGPSGAGKSSLLRGLLGVWPARAGTARIDDAAVASWDRSALGPAIGYLPQEVGLFAGTVAANIARFAPDASADAVVAAAKAAGVHELILALPEGYDTALGPGGAGLSAGQRQRIGLARALYGDPAILVLDEPSASLDEPGEAAVTRVLAEGRARGRTQLVAAPRPAVRAELSRLIVLKAGRIALDDTAQAVMAQLQRPSTGGPSRAPASAAGDDTSAHGE